MARHVTCCGDDLGRQQCQHHQQRRRHQRRLQPESGRGPRRIFGRHDDNNTIVTDIVVSVGGVSFAYALQSVRRVPCSRGHCTRAIRPMREMTFASDMVHDDVEPMGYKRWTKSNRSMTVGLLDCSSPFFEQEHATAARLGTAEKNTPHRHTHIHTHTH